jgi:hypothetical protein
LRLRACSRAQNHPGKSGPYHRRHNPHHYAHPNLLWPQRLRLAGERQLRADAKTAVDLRGTGIKQT